MLYKCLSVITPMHNLCVNDYPLNNKRQKVTYVNEENTMLPFLQLLNVNIPFNS